jgi:hypothetical protein
LHLNVSTSEWLPRYSCLNLTLDFCFCGWISSEVYKRKVNTPDELLARILDAAACIKKREDQLRRTTRDLRTRVAKCTEVDGGIFEHLL